MIAQVLEQDSQKMILLAKGRRKSWRFILKIAIGILLVFFTLLKLIGISWWLAALISTGGTLPFLVVLATLFRRIYEPDRYFIFDKAWNIFQYKLNLNEEKTLAAFPLSSLANLEGNYNSTSNLEDLVLEFNINAQETQQLLLYTGQYKDSTLGDREHIRLFLQG